jgi:hypothetical protein
VIEKKDTWVSVDSLKEVDIIDSVKA